MIRFVVAASRLSVYDKVCLRTYLVPDDPATAITVIDAVLATCASPSQFLPVSSGATYERCEYVGAGIGANNPLRQVILEAYSHFGRKSSVALVLSLGSGHPGILALETDENDSGLHDLMLGMMADSEQEASLMERQMAQTSVYHRFSVVQGLQKIDPRVNGLDWIAAQTNAYSKLLETENKLKKSTKKAHSRHGIVLLENLGSLSGRHLPFGSFLTYFKDHVCGLTPPSTISPTMRSSFEYDLRRFQEVEVHSVPYQSLQVRDDDILHAMHANAVNYYHQLTSSGIAPQQIKMIEARRKELPNEVTKLKTLEDIELFASVYYNQLHEKNAELPQRDIPPTRRAQAGHDDQITAAMEDFISAESQDKAPLSNECNADAKETSTHQRIGCSNPVATAKLAQGPPPAHGNTGGFVGSKAWVNTSKHAKHHHSFNIFRHQPQGSTIGKLLSHAVPVVISHGSSVGSAPSVREDPTIARAITFPGLMTSLAVGPYVT